MRIRHSSSIYPQQNILLANHVNNSSILNQNDELGFLDRTIGDTLLVGESSVSSVADASNAFTAQYKQERVKVY